MKNEIQITIKMLPIVMITTFWYVVHRETTKGFGGQGKGSFDLWSH